MSKEDTTVLAVEPARRKMLRKKSFTDALKEKYCEEYDPNDNNNIVIIVYGRRNDSESSDDGAELAHLRIAGLSNSRISHAGLPQAGLKDLCPNITELDLQGNLLTQWSEALTILSNLRQLKFVNLSKNKLQNNQDCLETWPTPLPSLEELVLNSTSISWEEVISLAKRSPILKEIHLCHNGYTDICEGDLQAFHGIETLRLNDNNIVRWSEVWKLRSLPNLQSLILSGNPVRDVYYDQSEYTEPVSSESKQSHNPLFGSTVICSDILENVVKKVVQNHTAFKGKKSDNSFAAADTFLESDSGKIICKHILSDILENIFVNGNKSQSWLNKPVNDKNSFPDSIVNDFVRELEPTNSESITDDSSNCKLREIEHVNSNSNDIESVDVPTNVSKINDSLLSSAKTNFDNQSAGCNRGHSQKTCSCHSDDIESNVTNMMDAETSSEESKNVTERIKDAVRITVLDGENSSSVTFSLNSDKEQLQDDPEDRHFVQQQNCDQGVNSWDGRKDVAETCDSDFNQSNCNEKRFHKSQSAPELLKPFQSLSTLCLSHTSVNDWEHLHAMRDFPNLKSLRITNITLGSDLSLEDRRKLYISSLPSITVLNGGEIKDAERDKAERYFVRHFISQQTKPARYLELEKKHGTLDQLVEIDLTRGFQEWVSVKFVHNGREVLEDKIHMLETVGKLRQFIKDSLDEKLRLKYRAFKIWHLACGPFHVEAEVELEELFLTSLPLSRFDIQEGDEIHIELVDVGKKHSRKNIGFLERLK